MDQDRLVDLRDETEDMLKATELADHPKTTEFDKRFDDAAEKLEQILVGDISEWVGRFYRDRYHRWQSGDRERPMCRCENPRCPLKRGDIPYRLRRRDSQIRTDGGTDRDMLSGYLDNHPQAVIIDEALDRQGELATELARAFRQLQREIAAAIEAVIDGSIAEDKSGN